MREEKLDKRKKCQSRQKGPFEQKKLEKQKLKRGMRNKIQATKLKLKIDKQIDQ